MSVIPANSRHGRTLLPAVTPVLDPLFRPAALARRAFEQHARDTGRPVHVRFALEQAEGAVSHCETDLVPDGDVGAGDNFRMLERLVKQGLPHRTVLTALGPGFTCSCLSLAKAA